LSVSSFVLLRFHLFLALCELLVAFFVRIQNKRIMLFGSEEELVTFVTHFGIALIDMLVR
jgi:hypothetical protein